MKEKNIFISHHSNDDSEIQKLKDLLSKKGYRLKNSSIDNTKPNRANNEEYIKKILKDRIQWAGCEIVLIGKDTHKREWVNWEIKIAAELAKTIIGIFIQGASNEDIPEELWKYGDALLGWQSSNIIEAIEGRYYNFENPDGSTRISSNPIHRLQRDTC